MHQSFVVPGPGNSGAFNFSVFKALLNALHCGDKFIIKSLLKSPRPPEIDNNEEQQMTWTIWINFLPLSHGGSTLNLAFSCFREDIWKTHRHTDTHTHTFFAHQIQWLRVVPDEKMREGGGERGGALKAKHYIFVGGGRFFQFSGQLAFVKTYNFLQVVVLLKNAVCSNGICWNEKRNPILEEGSPEKKKKKRVMRVP